MFIRRYVIAFAVWISLVGALWAASVPGVLGGGVIQAGGGGGGGGYTGPGDLASITWKWWSGARAYNGAQATANGKIMSGQKHNAGGAAFDILALSTGAMDVTTADSSGDCNVGGGDYCNILTIYDKSGANACSSAACDMGIGAGKSSALQHGTQNPTTNGTCGLGTASLPCIWLFTGNAPYFLTAAAIAAQTAPVVCYFVGQRPTSSGTYKLGVAQVSGVGVGATNANDTAFINAGGSNVTGTATDGSYHTYAGYFTGGAGSELWIDGTLIATGNAGSASIANTVLQFGGDGTSGGGNVWNNSLIEGGCGTVGSDAIMVPLHNNVSGFWGVG